MSGHYAVDGSAGEMELQRAMGAQKTSLRVPHARQKLKDLVFYLLGFLRALIWLFLLFSFGVGTFIMCCCTLDGRNLTLHGLTVRLS